MTDYLAARNIIANMPDRWRNLGRTIAGRVRGGGEFVSGKEFESKLPLDAHTVDLRTEVVASLADLAAELGDRSGYDATPIGRHPQATAAFILAGWRWVVVDESGWADDTVDHLVALAARVDDVLDPPEQSRTPAGRCVVPGCAGNLTAIVRKDAERLSVIRCDECSTRWLPSAWPDLRAQQAEARQAAKDNVA